MPHRRPRRRFTREYKAQAVQRLIESGTLLADIAAELDVSPGQLSQGRNEQLAAGSAEALAARKAEQAETQRLRREVKRLEEEVEILTPNGTVRPVCRLNCPRLPVVPTRQRLTRASSDTSGALLPSGSAVTATACALNMAQSALVAVRRSLLKCGGTGCAGPPPHPSGIPCSGRERSPWRRS